jgi:hypothetical protein
MSCIITLLSVMDHIYDLDPIRLQLAKMFILPGDIIAIICLDTQMLNVVLQLSIVFSTITCCIDLYPNSNRLRNIARHVEGSTL